MKKEIIQIIALIIILSIISIVTLYITVIAIGYIIYNITVFDIKESQFLGFIIWCILAYKTGDYIIKRYS